MIWRGLDAVPLRAAAAFAWRLWTSRAAFAAALGVRPCVALRSSAFLAVRAVRAAAARPVAAREALTYGQQLSLRQSLEELFNWCLGSKAISVWANGPSFDIAILEHAYGYYNLPWKYNAARDFRTLRALVPPNLGDGIPKGEAHNALDDAMAQALFVRKALRYLQARG